MTPAAIIERATADGVNLAPTSAGTIKAVGDADMVRRWAPLIREHKPSILAELRGRTAPIPDDLEHLIVRAGTFYEYSPEDYDLIRAAARRDPDGLRLALETDMAFSQARGH